MGFVAGSATLLMIMAWLIAAMADSCLWEAEIQSARYTFNLAAPMNGFAHGIRSEDGFYKVYNATNGEDAVFWFQPCEHMKFNHDPPICEDCLTCGGPDHCGETCSALLAVSHTGFSVCKTLGFASTTSYSLIDNQKPENGLVISMAGDTSQGNCSFSVSVFCSKNGEEFPTLVSGHACHYSTTLKHPAGCPVVTTLEGGGIGWFSTLFLVMLCLFVVYMVAATIYRRKALGIAGSEAVPHMEFWRSIPSNIQWGVEYMIAKATSLYRRVAEPSYVGVNG